METFLNIISFPGHLAASLIYEYKFVFFVLFLLGAFYLSIRVQKKENSGIFGFLLVFSALLFSMLPGLSGFYAPESPFFVFCISAGIISGWIYGRFILKERTGGKDFGTNGEEDLRTPPGWSKYFYPLLVLFLAALLIRIAGIDRYPAGYSNWELDRGYHATKYFQGEQGFEDWISLFKRKGGQSSGSPFMMGLSLIFYKILGVSLLTGRFLSVFLAFLGLLFLFLFLRFYLSVPVSIFLLVFPAFELSNVIFGRTGFNYISAFTFGTGILLFFQLTFRPAPRFALFLKAFAFSFLLYASIYMYFPARAMVAVIGLLILFNMFLTPGFTRQFLIPISVIPAVLLLTAFIHLEGDLYKFWPQYSGYLLPNESSSVREFGSKSASVFSKNLTPALKKIAFEDKAIDSRSSYSRGGLISRPALLFLPLAFGFMLSRFRDRFTLFLLIILFFSLLPAVLSGVPNSRRLILFNGFLGVVSGIGLWLTCLEASKILPRIKNGSWAVMGIIILFSYNLFIFLDVNRNMGKWDTLYMPFGESGFGDVNFSPFKLAAARKAETLLQSGDVFLYYSDTHDEPAFAPNGTYEQMLVQGFPQIKKGAKLRWMNPFYSGFQGSPARDYENSFFVDFQDLTDLILQSGRTVHVYFVKPLADELGILLRLQEEFPEASIHEERGNGEGEVFYWMTVSSEIIQKRREFQNSGKASRVSLQSPGKNWILVQKQSYVHPYSANRFFVEDHENYLYSKLSGLFDHQGRALTPDASRDITRILEKEGKYYILRGDFDLSGVLTVYDGNFKLLEEISLHGYPFDGFWGPKGELYILYLEFNGIGVFETGKPLSLWETGEFSKLPIWNGTLDEEGDFILISSGKTALILGPDKKLKNSFPVDVSWKVFPNLLRDRGGVVSEGKFFHLLNSYKNQVVSYSKNGERKVGEKGRTLFDLPEGFQAAFIGGKNGIIHLINRGEPRFFLSYRQGGSGLSADL